MGRPCFDAEADKEAEAEAEVANVDKIDETFEDKEVLVLLCALLEDNS
jgi:hypothetical protein